MAAQDEYDEFDWFGMTPRGLELPPRLPPGQPMPALLTDYQAEAAYVKRLPRSKRPKKDVLFQSLSAHTCAFGVLAY